MGSDCCCFAREEKSKPLEVPAVVPLEVPRESDRNGTEPHDPLLNLAAKVPAAARGSYGKQRTFGGTQSLPRVKLERSKTTTPRGAKPPTEAELKGEEATTKLQARFRGWLERHGKRCRCPTGDKPQRVGNVFPVPKSEVMNHCLLWAVAGEYRDLPGEAFAAEFGKLEKLPKGWQPVTRDKFLTFKTWQQQRALKSLAEKPPFLYNFPHREVTPITSLSQISWAESIGVQRSGVGTEGVLFVELLGKQAVVVKAPSNVAAEMYGTQLAKHLQIPCPDMRMVSSWSQEGSEINTALLKLDSQRPAEARKVAGMLKGKPAFLIIEYLQATELADLLPVHNPEDPTMELTASVEWCKATFGLPSNTLSAKGTANLKTMGKLIAFDMLINNYDRLPCIWQNRGNPGNVMFRKDDDSVISIDNMLSCISSQAANKVMVEQYLAKVRATSCAVLSRPQEVHEDFAKIRSFLKDGCPGRGGCGWLGLDIDVGEEGVRDVQSGFVETVDAIVTGVGADDSRPLTKELMVEVEQQLFKDLYGGVPEEEIVPLAERVPAGFDAIDPDFMAAVADVFVEAHTAAATGSPAFVRPEPALEVLRLERHRSGRDLMRLPSGSTLAMGPSQEEVKRTISSLLTSIRAVRKFSVSLKKIRLSARVLEEDEEREDLPRRVSSSMFAQASGAGGA